MSGYIGNPPTPITDSDLAGATLSITASANYPDGTSEEPETHTIPLQTTAHVIVITCCEGVSGPLL